MDPAKEARLEQLRAEKAQAEANAPIGAGTGILRTIGQDLSLGASDEILAGVEALATTRPGAGGPEGDYFSRLGQNYQERQQQRQQQLGQFQAENPLTTYGTEFATAVGAVPLAARALASRSAQAAQDVLLPWGQRAWEGFKTGLGVGVPTAAVAGAMTAPPGQRMKGAMTGAAIGGPMGGGFGTMFGTALPAVNRAMAQPPTPERRALTAIRERATQEGYTPEQAAQEAMDMGPRAVLGDVSPGLRQMLATSSKQPSSARAPVEALTRERSEGASGRIMAALARNLGPPEEFNAQARAINETMRREAGPAYEVAYQTRIKPTPFMENLIANEDSMAAKMWRGRNVEGLAREEAIAQGQEFNPMSLYNPDGTPSMKGWDFLKRALYQAEQRASRSGNNQLSASMKKQRRKLTQDLKDQSDDYRDALETWSGGSDVLDAMEAGRKAIGKNSIDVADDMADMNRRQQQGFRLGYARALLGKIEGEGFSGGTPLTGDTARIFHKPDARRSLEVVFGSKVDADEFISTAINESKMQATFDAIRGGSPSFQHLAEAQSQMGQSVFDAGLGYMTGTQSLPQAVMGAARKLRPTIPTTDPEYTAAVTRQLGLEGPAAFAAREQATTGRAIPLRQGARAAGAAGGLVGGAGGVRYFVASDDDEAYARVPSGAPIVDENGTEWIKP